MRALPVPLPNDLVSLYVDRLHFRVFDPANLPVQDKRAASAQAAMVLDVRSATGWEPDVRKHQTALRCMALWVDPMTNESVRAYCAANPRDYYQRAIVRYLFRSGSVSGTRVGNSRLRISASRTGEVILTLSDDAVYSRYSGSEWDHKTYMIYPSTSAALRAATESSSRRLQVGGLQMVNLSVVTDAMMIELGYTRVPDILGNAPPMWMVSETLDAMLRRSSDKARNFVDMVQSCL